MIGSSKVLVTAVLLSLVSGAGAGAFVSVQVSVPREDIGQAIGEALVRHDQQRTAREMAEQQAQRVEEEMAYKRQMKDWGKCDNCRATLPWGEKR